MRTARGQIDTKYGALYYPWVVVSNPLARPGRDDIPREITLPPSGFVSCIYARNDTQRGVYKAPANEVVTGALRFESDINFAQQELLNPLGRELSALPVRPRLPAVGARGWHRVTLNGNTFPTGVISITWKRRSTAARSGGVRAQRRTAVGQRATDHRRLSLQTNGAAAHCWAAPPTKPISCAATARR